jgi:hypothetical protein
MVDMVFDPTKPYGQEFLVTDWPLSEQTQRACIKSLAWFIPEEFHHLVKFLEHEGRYFWKYTPEKEAA